MTRTKSTFKGITTLTAALTAWTIFALYTINASANPMIEAVKAMS